MIRALIVIALVVALAVPELAQARSNGGVAAFSVVAAPKPPKKRKRRKRTPTGHVIPVAGPFTWPGPDGMFNASRTGHIHQGVDLLAPKGTPVVANVSGVVEFRMNPRGGLAYYLHGTNGVLYYGAHLATFVGRTRHVRAGETIGTVGNTGNASGGAAHLHFEKMPGGGRPVDPYPALARVCPRR